MTATNTAALQGWVKSTDPKTGRAFYANHVTRKTQWDPPEGWVEATAAAAMAPPPSPDNEEPLPPNWEVMHDPTSGKPFYLDHERKITTWTRPRPEPKTTQSVSFQPAKASSSPSSGNASSALARILAQSNSNSTARSYFQEASYYSPTVTQDVDLSDSLPPLDFTVKKVADTLRPNCPQCDLLFTLSKRRHHCRLCGDVFCDACSNHRVTLPLDGPEFDKPVRVCDYCFDDVDQGNFFSMRRYLTPLHLYNHNTSDDEENSVASAKNVNAALSALTQDLEQMLHHPSQEKRMTIPPHILLPEIVKHLPHHSTVDRAIRAVSALLALETLTNATDYSSALYLYGATLNDGPKKDGKKTHVALEHILLILDRSGTDRKTLFVQEQAARTLFYLVEPKTITAAVRKHAELQSGSLKSPVEDNNNVGSVEDLDLLRAVRSMLDHSSASKNPNLQRWAAACLKNLILEDQRRSCLAANDVAAAVASGEKATELDYESFLPELVSTGGIMILCSLIGSDDADTRAHAIGALAATLQSTREIDASMVVLSELSNGSAGRVVANDGNIVRAIVAGGGCGGSVSQMLLSADHAVAGMGCNFLSSLVGPLLSASGFAGMSSHYDYRQDESGVGACREASIEIATGSCLSALLSLVRESSGSKSSSRPIDLRKLAMETLAATAFSVGEMGKSWAAGKYEEGLEQAGAPAKLKEAIILLNEEGAVDVSLEVLMSGSGQSLGSKSETPASRIREAAGIVLGSLTSCSADAVMELQTKQILSPLLLASNDASMTVASTLRGDGAPRCLGVLETVSAIVMFAWQHPSGAESVLLDRLIELMDAGVVPYLSKIINAPMDWESKEKSIGSMKAKAAGCRLLCCLFGIALTDETGIGNRRLMDAIASDARGYRGGDRMPRDIIEATLGVLQTSSNYARRTFIGSQNTVSMQYESALMDLVDAALLAVGSICGSSVAPGGSEGTMVTGESFLTARGDQYVEKRKDICRVACDIVVRSGRAGPALLSTMLVGGFGEGTVLSSVRLALAVAQNGSKEEHAKLALSGLLVPISDSLRAALTRGDLYRFSASLALVRFCGPHLAAGQGGGIESVRTAIRVATNVLTLPINPDASIEQMETQELLKSECISALESLSRNASLWSSISTEALPSIVQYLHSTAGTKTAIVQHQKTRTAALRAVLQIVQVPSHAVAAAESGIIAPLGNLLRSGDVSSADNEVPMLALEIIHALCSNKDARRKAHFLEGGLAQSICAAIGKSATETSTTPTDSQNIVTLLGLEILHLILADVEDKLETQAILQSTGAIAFLDAVASEPAFVRSLCATLLSETNMKLPRHDQDQGEKESFDIPKHYGPPLLLITAKCAGYATTHEAAAAILFTVSVYACAIDSQRSDAFWKTVQLQDLTNIDFVELTRLSATFCAHMLALLAIDYKPFVPTDAFRFQDYVTITRPLIRYRLLEILKDSMDELTNQSVYGNDSYVISLLVGFNVPHICLSLWKDPAILDLAFELIKKIVEQEPDEVMHLFVEGKTAIMSLFDLLNLDSSLETSKNVGEIRRFLAFVLGQLAENGLLASAVDKFDVRSSAIAALAAACVSEEERPPDEDEDMTSNRLSTVLMRCLVELCAVKTNDGSANKRIQLSSLEAEAIAKNLGKKLCHMVLSRFLERAKLQQYQIEEDEDLLTAPDVAMLCAIAQHDDALMELRSVGGLHALSLVAAEGEISAVIALEKACKENASVLLEGDTYQSLMNLVSDDKRHGDASRTLEASAFKLLARLCNSSLLGRQAIAESKSFEDCVRQAIHIVCDYGGGKTADHADKKSIECVDSNDVNSDDEADTPPPSYSIISSSLSNDSKDVELEVSACFFLAAVTSISSGRIVILEENICIESLSSFASKSENIELMFASLQVLANLAPYTKKGSSFTVDNLFQVVSALLTYESKFVSNPSINENIMLDTAVTCMNVIFDSLSDDKARILAIAVSSLFTKKIKSCSITRSTTRETERAFAAELIFNLSTALILVRGKAFMNDVFTQDLLVSFIHLIQWRLDPKTVIGASDAKFWDASVTNCLALISTLLMRPDESLFDVSINLKSLAQTSLMLARPGKAPRRAIDLKSALDRLIESTDSLTALSAKRVLARLYD